MSQMESNREVLEQVDEASFPHPVDDLQRLETHISWIFLTGKFAYKIKKAVDLGFVNYTTLEQRKHFCELEVELNRRFAADLYLGVVPIWRTPHGLRFGDVPGEATSLPPAADDSPVEYAVKMREFPQSAIAANRLQDPAFNRQLVSDFGKRLAEFHGRIEVVASDVPVAQPRRIRQDAMENYDVLLPEFGSDRRRHSLQRLRRWTDQQAESLSNQFALRLQRGLVRRCHGDLHLKNMILLEGRLHAFDGIEFNEEFQCIDVLSEVAFPVMDCCARGRPDLAWWLLNAYLEESGDYPGLDVLRFYLVYRAMVRAKVAWLNPNNRSEIRRKQYASEDHPQDRRAGPWDKYLAVAEQFAFSMRPKLAITHGFSGSGKSTVALQIIGKQGGVRIRSDVERHRLTHSISGADKYTSTMTDRVYTWLVKLANAGIQAGFPMIIDATFLKRQHRRLFQNLAAKQQVPFEIIHCDAEFDELCERLRNRTGDASEADIKVLHKQLDDHDPLTAEETALATNSIPGGV